LCLLQEVFPKNLLEKRQNLLEKRQNLLPSPENLAVLRVPPREPSSRPDGFAHSEPGEGAKVAGVPRCEAGFLISPAGFLAKPAGFHPLGPSLAR
jgi:hypothetical protein